MEIVFNAKFATLTRQYKFVLTARNALYINVRYLLTYLLK